LSVASTFRKWREGQACQTREIFGFADTCGAIMRMLLGYYLVAQSSPKLIAPPNDSRSRHGQTRAWPSLER